MPNRRTVLTGIVASTTAGFAGCIGGGGGEGEAAGGDGASAIGETVFDGDTEDFIEITHGPRFEEGEFSDVMFVEGEAENITEDSRLSVELAIETDFRLDSVTAENTIDPGETWAFDIEYDNVQEDRLEEYRLTVSFTAPPEAA